jgi:hypothetical protein
MTSICLLVIVGIKVPMWLSAPTMETGEIRKEIPTPDVEEPVEEIPEVVVAEEINVPEVLPEQEQTLELPLHEDLPEEAEVTKLLDGVSNIDEAWVMRELEEHQDEIEQDDLEEGLAILDKIDANYLYEMSEGGFTEEEKAKAEAFLKAELPEEDVQAVWGLIHKYMELVK